jgi:F-type H+-transporting ATPase subunit b
MGGILSQLGHLFLQSTPTILFVFLLFLILERIFFRPLIAMLQQREEATRGALARAREQVAAAEAKSREYEAAFQRARQEVYRQREAEGRAALAERESTLQQKREQAETLIKLAEASVAGEIAKARQDLDQSVRRLAEEIADSVLGRNGWSGEAGGSPH